MDGDFPTSDLDRSLSLEESDLEDWVEQQRKDVEAYLAVQGIEAPNVGEWPAFKAAPYFAIWVVESKKTQGKVGWWAFSGDCPTDYVSERGECHPRAALGTLLENWRNYIPQMRAGRTPPGIVIASESDLPRLADLLESRVRMLQKWHRDDGLWDEL